MLTCFVKVLEFILLYERDIQVLAELDKRLDLFKSRALTKVVSLFVFSRTSLNKPVVEPILSCSCTFQLVYSPKQQLY